MTTNPSSEPAESPSELESVSESEGVEGQERADAVEADAGLAAL